MNSHVAGNLVAKSMALVVGLILLLPSACKLYEYSSFRARATAVYGVVERPLWGGDMGGRPLVAFRDSEGVRHEFKTRAKIYWFSAPRKGDRVRVLYLESEPDRAIADSLSHYLVIPLCFMAVGAAAVFHALRQGWAEVKQGAVQGRAVKKRSQRG